MYVFGLKAKIRDFLVIGKIKSRERYVGKRYSYGEASIVFYSKERSNEE